MPPGAGTTTPYWWGEKVDGRHVLCRKCGSAVDHATPPPVNSQPANPWGLVAMSGGVREWLADCWLADLRQGPGRHPAKDGEELPPIRHPRRLLARRT